MLFKIIFATLAFFIFGCDGGGGGPADETSSTTTSTDTTDTTDETSTSADDCDETTQLPDAPAAAGQLTFKIGADIDPCLVGGYVVGYNDLLKVKRAEDGLYFIDNVPDGEHDVIITAGSLAVALKSKGHDRGKRHKNMKFLNGVRTEKEEIELPKMGSLSGTVTLNGQTDHAGIDVYIPGTEYIAKTDSDGKYSFSALPVGEHNLYFEKDGYHRGQIEDVDIEVEKAVTATDIELVLSTGAEGFVQIQGGVSQYNSRTVSLIIGATSDAVLMKLSESETFTNISWQPIITKKTYTFNSDGEKNLNVKFADANGLESSPFQASITIDTTVPSFTVSSNYTARAANMTLTITATDLTALSMKVAESSEFSVASWETFSSTKTMSYAKVVKVQLKDEFGHESAVTEHTVSYTATLSVGREQLSATTVGNKALFAGGIDSSASNIVDIYDGDTNTWSTATLSQARRRFTATTVGTKAVFAGGDNYTGTNLDVVDIYDSNNNTWSTATLSQARNSLASTTVGTKAIFAGGAGDGGASAVVDIYDSSNNTWSTATLSQARASLAATTIGSKAIFAGGWTPGAQSNRVDIYDNNTDTWSTATLSEGRNSLGATTVGTKALFAGGYPSFSSTVDIFDSETNTWSTATLSQGRGGPAATTVGTKAIFVGGGGNSDRVDIYDFSSNSWSTATLSQGRQELSAIKIGTKAIFAGGQSAGYSNVVDIYDSETNTWSTEL